MKRAITRTIIAVLTLGIGFTTALAQTTIPAGQDELRIYTGVPKKTGESIVSISGRWRTKDGLATGSTGLAFIKGPDLPKADDANSVAKRIVDALISGMTYLRPSLRGIKASLVETAEDSQVIMKNKQGISLNQITIRDFTNEKFTVEIVGSSFGAKGVEVAIGLADFAEVANIVINTAVTKQTFRAQGGGIEVSLGNEKPVKIDTTNKTLSEIEKVLATKLPGGEYSTSPLFTDERARWDKKNIKPFDGGEVHINGITVNTITIDVNDPSLGVITKYKFTKNTGNNKGSSWW